MTATIIRADTRNIPLPDASVDLIVTSPPYFALRSYTDGGEHYAGQIGAEESPQAYVAALIECTREWVRVLKPSGSLFVNLGDKYAGSPSGPRKLNDDGWERDRSYTETRLRPREATPPAKSLMFLPERYRIAAVDELGLIGRAVLVWSKPNGLPESVTDRVRRSHEDWVHLTKQPRYFSAVDEIREQHSPGTHPGRTRTVGSESGNGVRHRTFAGNTDMFNPLGKLPGSVWEVATEPLKVPAELGVDHFAAFPTEWPRRIVQGWSPSGICTACGEGRRPVAERVADGRPRAADTTARDPHWRAIKRAEWQEGVQRAITGEACACPEPTAPTRPAVVLDPFGGTGTTALVASVLGRHGISGDMSADYCRLARWRTADPGQRAKAARLAAPPKQLDGQQDLFTKEAVA